MLFLCSLSKNFIKMQEHVAAFCYLLLLLLLNGTKQTDTRILQTIARMYSFLIAARIEVYGTQ